MWKFSLDDIRGPVHTTQKVTIPPFSTVSVHANTSVKGHYAGSCIHRTDTRSPVASSSGTDHDLWRIAPLVLKGTHLPVQLEHLYFGISCKGHGQTGCPCQPSSTGSPPNQGLPKSHITNHKKDGSWRPWTSKVSKNGLNQSRNRPESYCSNGSTYLCTMTWIWAKLLWLNIKYRWQIGYLSKSITDVYLLSYMMMWGPIFRKCWILVLSISHTVHGLVQ